MRSVYATVAIALSLLATTCARAAEEKGILLRLDLKPGQVFRVEGKLDQKITIHVPTGGKMEVTTAAEGINRVKVLKKNGKGNYVLEMVGERLKARNKSPMMDFQYDTAKAEDRKKEGALLGKYYRLLCDTPLTVTVDPRGQVLAVKGVAGIRKKLEESFPEARQQVKAMFANGQDKNLCKVFTVLPAAAVSPGGTWMQVCNAGKLAKGRMTMRFVKQEGNDAVVEPTGYSVKFGPAEGEKVDGNPLAAMARNMKATRTSVSGRTVLDRATGMTRSSKTRIKMDYQMKMSGQEKTVGYSLDQNASSRLLPAAGAARKPEAKKSK